MHRLWSPMDGLRSAIATSSSQSIPLEPRLRFKRPRGISAKHTAFTKGFIPYLAYCIAFGRWNITPRESYKSIDSLRTDLPDWFFDDANQFIQWVLVYYPWIYNAEGQQVINSIDVD